MMNRYMLETTRDESSVIIYSNGWGKATLLYNGIDAIPL